MVRNSPRIYLLVMRVLKIEFKVLLNESQTLTLLGHNCTQIHIYAFLNIKGSAIDLLHIVSDICEGLESPTELSVFPPLLNAYSCSMLHHCTSEPLFIIRVYNLILTDSQLLHLSEAISTVRLLDLDSRCNAIHYFGEENHKDFVCLLHIVQPNHFENAA
jgi:hypothetical protein